MIAHASVDRAEHGRPCVERTTWWERHAQMILPVPLAVGCGAAVFLSASAPGAEPSRLVAASAAAVAVLPFAACFLLAWRMGASPGRAGLELHVHATSNGPAAEVVKRTWSLERDRYRRSVCRAQLFALLLGALGTVFLTCAALLLRAGLAPGPLGPPADGAAIEAAAAVVAASTATAFVLELVKLTVRLASCDISATAFAWSARILALVVVASVGLLLVLPVAGVRSALLLGIVTGVTGEHAIVLLLDRAGKSLGVSRAVQEGPSPLLAVRGLSSEHAARLEEEGITSVEHLALAPTPRLFFNTPYGLPVICAWQDQALLVARVGAERARDLFEELGIGGAVALRKVALGVAEKPGEAGPTVDALRRVLRLEGDAPLGPLLDALRRDEAALRLELHATESVVLEPAQFDLPSRRDPAPDACVEEMAKLVAVG